MKADLTRSTDRPDQHYRAVRMQQGRVQLDAEWNEQHDILNRRIETETQDSLGAGAAVPMAHAGFLLSGAGGNVSISAGRCYVQGLLCEAGPGLSVVGQPGLLPPISPVVPAGQSLLGLPPAQAQALATIRVYNSAGAAVAPADGLYIGYVEAWLRHVTVLEDPLLREVALGVPDTTTRDQLVWQVKLLRAGGLGDALSCITHEPWNSFTQAPDGRFAARAQASAAPADPCMLTPEAGYRRLENQLYRVEVHNDGAVSGKARFKWSRDNGSIATRVTRWLGQPTANEMEVASVGRDATLAITAGCWLEFYSDTHDQTGQSGPLVQVLKTAGNVVTVDLASATGALDAALFAANPRVCRWDGWQDMAPQVSTTAAGWVPLEDGIEVKFTPGRYRTGDYWLVPARTATAGIEWPQDTSGANPLFVAPQGVMRAFARLAVLECKAGVWTTLADCRHLFPSQGELTNLHYVGGDGQQAMPNLLAPALVALPQPLEVAVFNGSYPVRGASVRFTASHGALPNGAKVDHAQSGPDGVVSIAWRLDPLTAAQTCKAELLEVGQPVVGRFNHIDFSATLETASQVAYNPAKCTDANAAGITTVQEALDALCLREKAVGCCTHTVGEGGDFPTLDAAINTLIAKEVRDIALCLLPGEHKLVGTVDKPKRIGTRLHVHGAGMASRLRVNEVAFELTAFASVEFESFEVLWTTDKAMLRLAACGKVRLAQMGLSGFPAKDGSVLQVEDAALLEISGCRIIGYSLEKLPKHVAELVDTVSFLKPLADSFDVASGQVFKSIDSRIVRAYAEFNTKQRREMGVQIDELLKQNSADQAKVNLDAHEVGNFTLLRDNMLAKAEATVLQETMEQWRASVMLSQDSVAVSLLDANAQTLVADNMFVGSLVLYGKPANFVVSEELQKKMRTVKFLWLEGRGLLRLRNNRLRGVRFGQVMADRLPRLLVNDDISLQHFYSSIVADANTFASAETLDLLAKQVSLGANAFDLPKQTYTAGNVIARWGKYIGNFAQKESVLLAFGHTPEEFCNTPLQIG